MRETVELVPEHIFAFPAESLSGFLDRRHLPHFHNRVIDRVVSQGHEFAVASKKHRERIALG